MIFKVKHRLRVLIFIFVFCVSVVAKADSDSIYSKPFLDSVFYGTLVGFLVGFVAYHGELGTYRCTSLGLYGGIILGLYISNKDNSPRVENEPVTSIDRSAETPQLHFSFNY